MKKLMALFLAAVMSVCMLTGCGNSNTTDTSKESATEAKTESDWQYIQDKGEMIIGITLFAPMNYYDEDNNFVGFDTELAAKVAERLGVEVSFVEINWDSKEIELSSKNIDCIWNGLTITEDRKKNMGITEPYLENTNALVMKADREDEIMSSGMAGLTVTAEQGSTNEEVVMGTAEGDAEAEVSGAEYFKDANYVTSDSQAKAMMEVKSGTADVAVVDTVAAAAMVGPGTDYEDLVMNTDTKFVQQYFGIGFRQNSDMVEKVNEIIDDLYEEGVVAEIAEKYNLTQVLMEK